MKKILVKNLRPGMITGEDIFAIDGQLILPQKAVLSGRNIDNLDAFGIYSIRVEDNTVPVSQILMNEEPSYSQRIKMKPEFRAFKQNFESHVDLLKTTLNQIAENNSSFDAENLLSQTFSLMDSVSSSMNLMDMLINMRDYDDSTYAHSVSCAIICNIFAGWLRLSKDERVAVTTCGLLHDIGKITIPEEVLKKPGKLTRAEFEVIKRHPLEGYNILSNAGFSEDIKNCALMHHEKCDGSGYPYGFTDNKISFFSKMITIVDIYDAMTSQRAYHDAICPFTVIEAFEREGFDKYDPGLILTFLRNVSYSFIGFRVRLNNGMEGDIVYISPDCLSRPTIKCGKKFIDLRTNPDLKIVAIV